MLVAGLIKHHCRLRAVACRSLQPTKHRSHQAPFLRCFTGARIYPTRSDVPEEPPRTTHMPGQRQSFADTIWNRAFLSLCCSSPVSHLRDEAMWQRHCKSVLPGVLAVNRFHGSSLASAGTSGWNRVLLRAQGQTLACVNSYDTGRAATNPSGAPAKTVACAVTGGQSVLVQVPVTMRADAMISCCGPTWTL